MRAIIDNAEPLSLVDKLSYSRQICLGLAYSHSKKVIHRDIKPENIMILDDGPAKIMDFGLARPESSNLTQAGTAIGTPLYMSPEQIKGLEVDERTDIFSFGVLLYELLTYRPPYQGSDITLIYKVPWCASSIRPLRSVVAPLKAPRTCPNNSLSIKLGGMAPQSIATKDLLCRPLSL